MLKLIDLICKNPKCKQEPYEDLLSDEEIQQEIKCPLCGKPLVVDLLNRPMHKKHLSWSKWNVDLGK